MYLGKRSQRSEEKKDTGGVSERLSIGHKNRIEWAARGEVKIGQN